jgi:hypothetical protein
MRRGIGPGDKEDGMASKKAARGYQDGFTAASLLDVDLLAAEELFDVFDAEGEAALFLTPWKRGSRLAIRSAVGH